MKNRRFLYVLLAAVLLVWGVIFHQIYQTLTSEPDTAAEPSIANHSSLTASAGRDTLGLLLNYKDPFLAGSVPARVTGSSASVRPQVKAGSTAFQYLPADKPATRWPAIHYQGLIKNAKSNLMVAMVKIDGKGYFLAERQQADSVTVSLIENDSIQVTYRGQLKYIRKTR